MKSVVFMPVGNARKRLKKPNNFVEGILEHIISSFNSQKITTRCTFTTCFQISFASFNMLDRTALGL